MTASTSEPPVGVVAMLFTDIEGSTSHAAELGDAWPEVLADHHEILSLAIAAEHGHVDGTEGDAFFAVFTDPAAAARAAVAAQRALHSHVWPGGLPELRVRMGMHVGFVERRDTGYVGLEVHRAARVASAAHGGQLLLTAAARETVGTEVATEFLGTHRLKDFPAPVQLYCANIDGRGAAAFPPPRTAEARPTNLPAGLPVLIGREDELERIRYALLDERERLVSLTGRGGSGKTSLARVAAAELLDAHPGGVWWVDLASTAEASRVLDALASAVGADREVQVGVLDAIAGRLAGSGPTLVVLDNLEHLLAARDELAQLLDVLPELKLLITTQVPLRIAAERVIALDALEETAALALIERVASRRGASSSKDPEDRLALAEVVRILDGLPLALELAAARLGLLTPRQLRDRLRSSFDLLRDATRPDRQQSLIATVQWTLGLLAEPARELFDRLAVFAGPAELGEIERVAGGDGLDVLEALSLLLDAALVRRIESGDGRIRFGLPEALRMLATQRLDARPDVDRWRRAHAESQLRILEVGTFCTRAQEEAALAARPEAAAALEWARRAGDEIAQPLAVWLAAWLATRGGLREAIAILAPLVEALPADPDLRATVAVHHAMALVLSGEREAAMRWSEQAVEWAESDRVRTEVLIGRALARSFGGQAEAALADNRAASRLARDIDDPLLCAALGFEAQALIAVGELDEASRVLDELREVGERSSASTLWAIDTQLGDLAMAAGRPEEALEPYARSLETAEVRGDRLQVLFDLRGMANALAQLGRDEDALEVLGLADEQAVEMGGSTEIAAHLQGDAPVRSALDRLGPLRAERARARGRTVGAGLRVARTCQLVRALTAV